MSSPEINIRSYQPDELKRVNWPKLYQFALKSLVAGQRSAGNTLSQAQIAAYIGSSEHFMQSRMHPNSRLTTGSGLNLQQRLYNPRIWTASIDDKVCGYVHTYDNVSASLSNIIGGKLSRVSRSDRVQSLVDKVPAKVRQTVGKIAIAASTALDHAEYAAKRLSPRHNHYVISELIVSPDWQNKGVARALGEAALNNGRWFDHRVNIYYADQLVGEGPKAALSKLGFVAGASFEQPITSGGHDITALQITPFSASHNILKQALRQKIPTI
jgi:ribosomal protein S18 acetylase RimI-like enzyme